MRGCIRTGAFLVIDTCPTADKWCVQHIYIHSSKSQNYISTSETTKNNASKSFFTFVQNGGQLAASFIYITVQPSSRPFPPYPHTGWSRNPAPRGYLEWP